MSVDIDATQDLLLIRQNLQYRRDSLSLTHAETGHKGRSSYLVVILCELLSYTYQSCCFLVPVLV